MSTKGIYQAIQEILDRYGDEARRYINWAEILKDPQVVIKELACSAQQISKDYLPGWDYESVEHYIFMCKIEWGSLQQLSIDTQRQHFISWWLRSLLVPSKTDYLVELAHTFRASDKRLIQAIDKDLQAIDDPPWVDKLKHLLVQQDMAGKLVSSKRESRYHVPTNESIYRWSREADTRRKARLEQPMPSAWQIDSITYHGEDLDLQQDSIRSVDVLDTHYLETWKWNKDYTGPAPRFSSIAFSLPAGPMTWETPWRKSKFKLEPRTDS